MYKNHSLLRPLAKNTMGKSLRIVLVLLLSLLLAFQPSLIQPIRSTLSSGTEQTVLRPLFLVVSFTPAANDPKKVLQTFGTHIESIFDNFTWRVRLENPVLTGVFLDILRQRSDVRYAHPDDVLSADETAFPNDPRYMMQWGLHQTDGIDAPGAWQRLTEILDGKDPTPTVVAVIDTGVDYTHEDLQGRLLEGYCVFSQKKGTTYSTDDSMSGHGTAVTGIIVASTDNMIGVAGVAGLFPVQVLPIKALDSEMKGEVSVIAQAIRYAADWEDDQGRTVSIINLSLGERLADVPIILEEAIDYARNKDIVVVASAGEDDETVAGYYPAAFDSVLSVTGVHWDHQPLLFSNTGADIHAPGSDIQTTVPSNMYFGWHGTSFATPFVSGVLALMTIADPNASAESLSAAVIRAQRQKVLEEDPLTYGYMLDAKMAVELMGAVVRPVDNLRSLSNDQAIRLMWDPPKDSVIDEYRIRRDHGPWTTVHDSLYIDLLLDANTEYVYDVVVVDGLGRVSELSTVTASTFPRLISHTIRANISDHKTDPPNRQADDMTWSADMSEDGRKIVFASNAGNLTDIDHQGFSQIYMHDRTSGSTKLISVTPDQMAGNANSLSPAISANGRFVLFAFESGDNLVENAKAGLYLWDDEENLMHYTGIDDLLDPDIHPAYICDLGRYILYRSTDQQITRYDRFYAQYETPVYIKAGFGLGTYSMSADGRYALFLSGEDLLADVPSELFRLYRFDFLEQTVQLVSKNPVGEPGDASDEEGCISPCGRYVSFTSNATNLISSVHAPALYLKDMVTGAISLVGKNSSGEPALQAGYASRVSRDGKTVAFLSNSANLLVIGDHGKPLDHPNVFLHDTDTGRTELVSRDYMQNPSNGSILDSSLRVDRNGFRVLYLSDATNLVADDTNDQTDVFLTSMNMSAPVFMPDAALEVKQIGSSFVTISWSPAFHPLGISSYTISIHGDFYDKVSGNVYEHTIFGLTEDTLYAITVEAADEALTPSTNVLFKDVTTLVDAIPALSLTAWVGGRVRLIWDPPSAAGDAVGYVLFRAKENEEFATIATVGFDQLEYMDEHLKSQTEYRYRVDIIDSADRIHPHTEVESVMTSTLYLDSAAWKCDEIFYVTQTIAQLATLSFVVKAEPHRQAFAAVSLDVYEEDGQGGFVLDGRIDEVLLQESDQEQGTYVGIYTLAADAAYVRKVEAVVKDGHSQSVARDMQGPVLPVGVQGALHITLDSAQGTLTEDQLVVWSASLGSGQTLRLEGPGEVTIAHLSAAADYTLRGISDNGHVWADQTSIEILPGMSTSLLIKPILPVSLQIQAVHPLDSQPLPEVTFMLYDASNRYIGTYRTDEHGLTPPITGKLMTGDSVIVATGLPAPSFPLRRIYSSDGIKLHMEHGGNVLSVVEMLWHDSWLDKGSVQGTVTDEQGRPVEGALVTVAGGTSWARMTKQTYTDAKGFYKLDAVPGTITVTAVYGEQKEDTRYVSQDIQFVLGKKQSVTHDFMIYQVHRYFIYMESLTMHLPTDQSPTVITPVDQKTAADLNFSVLLPDRIASQFRWLIKDIRLGHDSRYPIEVWAPKGMTLLVKADGRDAYGLHEQNIFVMTGLEKMIGVSFNLKHEAADWAVLQGRLIGPDGQLWDRLWTGGLTTSASQSSIRNQFIHGHSGEFTAYVYHSGSYELSMRYLHGWDLYHALVSDIPMLRGQVTNIGDIVPMQGGLFSSRMGNRISISPASTIVGGLSTVRIDYYNAWSSDMSDTTVMIRIDEGLDLVKESLTRDGQPLVDYTFEDGTLSIPIGVLPGGSQGMIRFQVRLIETNEKFVALTASISFTGFQSQHRTEVLGVGRIYPIHEAILVCPETVHTRNVQLHGFAPGESVLFVYDDELLLGQTDVAANGFWSLEIDLPDRGSQSWHSLQAVAMVDDRVFFSNPVDLYYDAYETQPRVVHVTFRQDFDAWPDQELLTSMFASAGEWVSFEPKNDVVIFPRQMLAGFPFEFILTFSDPDAVYNVHVGVEGPAGGEAKAVRQPDGTYYAYIETLRNHVEWSAGKIYVKYDTVDPILPKMVMTLMEGEPIFPDEDPDLLSQSIEPFSMAEAAPEFSYGVRVPFTAYGGHFNGHASLTMSAQSAGSATAPISDESVSYSIQNDTIIINISGYIPLSSFTSRDTKAPVWPEHARLVAVAIEDNTITLAWTPALDDLWIDQYDVYMDDQKIASVSGSSTTHTVTGLNKGEQHTFSVRALDASGKVSEESNRLTVTVGDDTALLTGSELVEFQAYSTSLQSELESVLRAAAPGGRVFTALRITGQYGGPIVDIIAWAKDALQLRSKFDELDALSAALTDCAPDFEQDHLDLLINHAKHALIASQLSQTFFIGASLTFMATGVGAAGGLAVAVVGMSAGFLMRREIRRAENAAREAFEDIRAQYDCEDPDSDESGERRVPSRRRDLASPVWKIDPSGYVYEVIDAQRVQGVTTTIFRSSSESGPWQVWDSNWYGEINPQITDIEGKYGWDVPPDWWMVTYEKQGYEIAYSEALLVPPPHFDVNIPLRSLQPPYVESTDGALNGLAIHITFDKFMRIDMLTPATIRVWEAFGDQEEITGQVVFEPMWLAKNPHDDTDLYSLSRVAGFVPDQPLTLGAQYVVTVNAVVSSYANIPMGDDYLITITASSAHFITGESIPSHTGTVQGYGLYAEGLTVALEAVAKTGYRFSHWQENGLVIGEDPILSVLVSGPRVLDAHFTVRKHTLTVLAPIGDGTTDPAVGTYEYDYGTDVSLSAVADTNWRFCRWVGGVAVPRSVDTSVHMNEDKTLRAIFKPSEYVPPEDTPADQPSFDWKPAAFGSASSLFYIHADAHISFAHLGLFVKIPKGAITLPEPDGFAQIHIHKISSNPEPLFDGFYGFGYHFHILFTDANGNPLSMEPSFRLQHPVEVTLDVRADDIGYMFAQTVTFTAFHEPENAWLPVISKFDEVKKMLTVSVSSSTKIAPVHRPSTFTDMLGHPMEHTVANLAATGIINGKSKTVFAPFDTLTRAEWTAMMIRLLKYRSFVSQMPTDTHTPFTDVQAHHWFFFDVGTAYALSLTTGVDQTRFSPNRRITAQEMIVMLHRTFLFMHPHFDQMIPTRPELSMPNAMMYEKTADWAQNAMDWAIHHRLFFAHDDQIPDPTSEVTRIDAVSILSRFMKIEPQPYG